MKSLIIIFCLLSGCSTIQPLEIPKIQAPLEYMEICKDFIEPADGSFTSFSDALIANKEVYVHCNNQNNNKKDFILKITR